MDKTIDQIMYSDEAGFISDGRDRREIRAKIANYIATLTSAGQRDPNRLAEYGLAYIRALREGPDSRYTGC
jgi:hypothetical protein